MKNTNWNIIFKLKEFSEYLSDLDLIQLSMSSKKLGQHLTKETIETLYFYPFVDSRDYISAVIKEENTGYGFIKYHIINPYKSLTRELTESKKRLRNDLKIFNKNIKNFIFSYSIGYFYLLYEIPSLFPNITTLVLKDSVFTMEVLQSLFDGLKYLENLILTENVVFKDAEISNENIISYPISLRSIKLEENRIVILRDKFKSISINKNNLENPETYGFNGTNQHLPNLISFDHYMSFDYPEDNMDVTEFIMLNPQIKCLKLSGYLANYELFDIIRDLKSLRHLEFKCDFMNENLDNYEIPVLHNINYLHLEILSEDIEDMIKGKFSNVVELTKEMDTSINYERDFLVESFPNLKKLKFIFNDDDNYINGFTLPELKDLESLEINLNFKEEKFKYFKWDVSACDKLNLVTFTKNEFYIPFEKFELNQELAKHWNLFYFPYKLTFRKHS